MKLRTAWILLVIGAVACGMQAGCNTVDSSEEKTLNGFTYSVSEVHDQRQEYNAPVEPHIELRILTQETFPCANYPLISDLSENETTLDINILRVEEVDFCLPAFGRAAAFFRLDLEPDTYTLNFNYFDESAAATLTVTDSSLVISSADTSFFKPRTEVYWRYPERSFAYTCRSTEETRSMCDNFEEILNESLEIERFTFPDYGTIPYPETGKQVDRATYYYYPDEEVYAKAGDMLNAYADSVVSKTEGAYLSVTNWKNRGYFSWTDIDN